MRRPSTHSCYLPQFSGLPWTACLSRYIANGGFLNDRFKTQSVDIRFTADQCLQATTPLKRTSMANTSTASATSTGPPRRKKSPSTSMELYTFRKLKRQVILWRKKVTILSALELHPHPRNLHSPNKPLATSSLLHIYGPSRGDAGVCV